MAIPTCSWVRSRLPLLAGGDAVGLDLRHVERHLMRCPQCRARLEALRETQAILASVANQPLGDPEPSLWPALAHQIRTSPRPSVRSAWSLRPRDAWPRRRLGWMLPGLGVAAALLLGLGLFSLAPRLRPVPGQPSEEVRQVVPANRPPEKLLRYSDEELAQMHAPAARRRPAPVYARRDEPEKRPAGKPTPPDRSTLTQ